MLHAKETDNVLISLKEYTKAMQKATGDKNYPPTRAYNHLKDAYGEPEFIDERGGLVWKMPFDEVPRKED